MTLLFYYKPQFHPRAVEQPQPIIRPKKGKKKDKEVLDLSSLAQAIAQRPVFSLPIPVPLPNAPRRVRLPVAPITLEELKVFDFVDPILEQQEILLLPQQLNRAAANSIRQMLDFQMLAELDELIRLDKAKEH